jgi:hypothetical protein
MEHLAAPHWLSLISVTLIAPAVYLSLLKGRDRTAAAIGSALCATSLFLVHAAFAVPLTAVFAMLLVLSFALINFELTIPASLCLLAATSIRPEGALFALVVFACLAARKAKFVFPAFALYIVGAGACFALPLLRGQDSFNFIRSSSATPWLTAWASSPMFAAIWWFVFPFAGEMMSSESRRKYLPFSLSLAAYLLFACTYVHPLSMQTLLPAAPLLAMLIAVGVARIIPAIAGDVPGVALRYTVAFLAAASLVTICFAQEWKQLQRKPIAAHPIAFAVVPVAATEIEKRPAQLKTPGQPAPAPLVSKKPPTVEISDVAQAALSKVKKQGEDSNESRSNGRRGGNAAAAAHFKPAKAVSSNPQQTVHAALYRAPEAVWYRRNYSDSLLPCGRDRGILWRWG